MLRISLALCFTLLGSLSHAALPPAPLTIAAAQEVANEFRDHYEDDFKYEMSRVSKSAFPTPEQSYVYAKYMNKAFANAGYSLDETLYAFFKSGGISGGTAGSPNVLFMQKLNLTQYAISLKSSGTANAFIKADAVSEKTITYAKNVAPEIPITNADYMIEGDPKYVVEGLSPDYRRNSSRSLGYVRQGSGPWKGWLYLDHLNRPGEQYGTGLVDTSDASQSEMSIWKALIGKKIKIEGTTFTAVGVQLGTPENKLIAVDPTFYDKKLDLIIKEL